MLAITFFTIIILSQRNLVYFLDSLTSIFSLRLQIVLEFSLALLVEDLCSIHLGQLELQEYLYYIICYFDKVLLLMLFPIRLSQRRKHRLFQYIDGKRQLKEPSTDKYQFFQSYSSVNLLSIQNQRA